VLSDALDFLNCSDQTKQTWQYSGVSDVTLCLYCGTFKGFIRDSVLNLSGDRESFI